MEYNFKVPELPERQEHVLGLIDAIMLFRYATGNSVRDSKYIIEQNIEHYTLSRLGELIRAWYKEKGEE